MKLFRLYLPSKLTSFIRIIPGRGFTKQQLNSVHISEKLSSLAGLWLQPGVMEIGGGGGGG